MVGLVNAEGIEGVLGAKRCDVAPNSIGIFANPRTVGHIQNPIARRHHSMRL